MAGLNPFDAPKASAAANPFDAPKQKGQAESNPFDGLKKAGSAVAEGASRLGQILDAPGYGVRRLLTGESDTDKQMTKERSFLGLEGAYKAAGGVPGVGHLLQGGIDTALQTVQDPLLFLGPLAKGLGVGAKAAGLINKTSVGRAATDALTWGGKVGRELGPEARDVAREASNKGSAEGARTSSAINRMHKQALNGLSDEDVTKVGEALNGEIKAEELPKNLQRSYSQLRRITNLDFSLRAKANNLIPGVKAPTALGDRLGFMEHYLPGTHEAEEVAKDQPAKTFNRLDPFDPRTLERDPFKVESASQVRSGFEGMAKNTGRQVGASKIREHLDGLLDKPQIRELFDVKVGAKGEGRTDWEKIKDGIKTAVGYPRAAVVSLSPRHAGNILDLLANTDPGAIPEALALATRLATADEKGYFRLTKEGRDLGALSGEFIERKPFFSQVPGLGKWTGAMNKITWAVDDAAKQVYAKRIAAKSGERGAGGRASRELVDYSNVAPITEKARYVAPFATFRTSIPGAVMGGVARNPARAALLNRSTGGAMYGGKKDGVQMFNPAADVGDMNVGRYVRSTLGTPFQGAATVAEEAMKESPEQPVRSLLGMPPKDRAQAVRLRGERYFTYGNAVDGKWLLNAAAAGIPEAQLLLQKFGLGEFPDRGLGKEALRQVFGVGLK